MIARKLALAYLTRSRSMSEYASLSDLKADVDAEQASVIAALEAEIAQVDHEIKPLYFVSHPDGSFSEANPQPGGTKLDCYVYAQCDHRHTTPFCEDPNCYIATAPQEPAVNAERLKELADMHHDLLVVMQAAWIDWQRGKGAESAMQWIENTLCGPGLIPKEDEPYAGDPQAYFDKHQASPFPECFCGRPSNSLWMGKGFCGDAHYKDHRATIAKAGAA